MDDPFAPTTISDTQTSLPKRRKRRGIFASLCTVLFFLCVAWIGFLVLPPEHFPTTTLFTIREGESLGSIVTRLEREGYARSGESIRLILIATGADRTVVPGVYLFDQALNAVELAKRIAKGEHGIEAKKITIPEGLARKEIAALFAAALPSFSTESFMEETRTKEGYLFPDTYFFYITATSSEVAKRMEANFATRTAPLQEESARLGKDFHDILTMASIVEEEVRGQEDRRIVSGILWRRIDIRMRLQVDATFRYINGKGTADLTESDLAIESPYNTYRNYGLPPTPIASPSLDAIDAALHPTKTDYLYYLSDKDGTTHFAKTFEEHKLNKEKYLR